MDNYRIPLIELKGIQVAEVCQIFERINQAGQPLNIYDIVVAKTFRHETQNQTGFYLRDLFDDFRAKYNDNYLSYLDDLTLLQMLAVCVNITIPKAKINNITDRYLNDLKNEHIELTWQKASKSFLRVFDFLYNHLHIGGPNLIPYRYFYLTLSAYFLDNAAPDYKFLEQYFWYYCFHNDDMLSNTYHLWKHIDLMKSVRGGSQASFDTFVIDKNKLRQSSYSSRGALSRSILAFFSNHEPRDWENQQVKVTSQICYILTSSPNLHHVFPIDHINKNPGNNKLDVNSLMNIVYLTQLTNLAISNQNPLE